MLPPAKGLSVKELVEFFLEKGILFKKIETIKPKELGSRKQVAIYLATDRYNFYNGIIRIDKKSTVGTKEVAILQQLLDALQTYKGVVIKKRHLIVKSPLCSKAEKELEKLGWIVYDIS